MKKFYANHSYRGRWFGLTFCCKTLKEAADILGTSTYSVRKYYGSGSKTNEPFEGIQAEAYCSRAVEAVGHRNKIDFEEAKKLVDIHCAKNQI